MELYYVDAVSESPDLKRKVHKASCKNLPVSWNRHKLGYFSYNSEALERARSFFNQGVEACRICCPEYSSVSNTDSNTEEQELTK